MDWLEIGVPRGFLSLSGENRVGDYSVTGGIDVSETEKLGAINASRERSYWVVGCPRAPKGVSEKRARPPVEKAA